MSTVEFWGYRDLRDGILRDVQGGRSCAIVGGRKCGGTSLLRKLVEELPLADWGQETPIISFIDFRAVFPRTPFDLFREIYRKLTTDLPLVAWDVPRTNQHYQEFLNRLAEAAPYIEEKYSPHWLAILVFDSINTGAESLGSDEAFQNLRNLLTNSAFADRFRMIAWSAPGGQELTGANRAFSNLDPKYLRILTSAEAAELAAAQTVGPHLNSGLLNYLIHITGRQPYLLLGTLRQLEGMPRPLDENVVFAAGMKFIRDRVGTLTAWLDDLGTEACKVYDLLINADAGGIKRADLRRQSRIPRLDPVLLRLQYHCLIEEGASEMVSAPGVLFRRWFRDNWSETATAPVPAPAVVSEAPKSDRHKSVFVVHGRNRKVRNATFSFLRSVGIQPIEWHEAVEATGNPAPMIGEILQAGLKMAGAVVVLLTPDDHACLRPEFRNLDDPQYETELTGQPRPNVLFEAGMAFAAFPRSTVLVKVGAIRPFSDIAGIHLLSIEGNGTFANRKEFIRRLKLAGCDLDDSGTEWQTEGDFSLLGVSQASAQAN